jgi:NADH-quinone oxidoreductase subunit C
MSYEQILKKRFSEALTASQFKDNQRIVAAADLVFPVLQCLKDDCGFDMLVDITAVDYLHYSDAKDRFGVVYCLLNTASGERLVVKTFLNEPDLNLPSAFPLWKGADWLEREVYDMFGIVFDGHPDLRRILMPEGFTSARLRPRGKTTV